jgi:hypothetical protein
MNHYMIRPAFKPWDLYNSWKEKHCGSINVIIKIYSNYMVAKKNINIRKIKIEMRNIKH